MLGTWRWGKGEYRRDRAILQWRQQSLGALSDSLECNPRDVWVVKCQLNLLACPIVVEQRLVLALARSRSHLGKAPEEERVKEACNFNSSANTVL